MTNTSRPLTIPLSVPNLETVKLELTELERRVAALDAHLGRIQARLVEMMTPCPEERPSPAILAYAQEITERYTGKPPWPAS